MKVNILILAAGKSKRMLSPHSKMLHLLANRPIISYVYDIANSLNPDKILCVTSPDGEDIRNLDQNISHSTIKIEHIIQEEPRGTGDAVKHALSYLKQGITLVMYGDHPLINRNSLLEVITKFKNNPELGVTILGFDTHKDNRYGRLILDKNKLKGIIEYADANEEQRSITICNSGIIAINNKYIELLINNIKNNNAANEYYLTDIVSIALENSIDCDFVLGSEEELSGINTQEELKFAEQIVKNKNSVYIAQITTAHGIKGHVKIKTFTENPDDIFTFKNVYDKNGKKYTLKKISKNNAPILIAFIKEVTDRNLAETLRGTELFVDRSELIALVNEEEFYYDDLIGLTIVENNIIIGEIIAIHNFGAGDIIEFIIYGKKESSMLPFKKEYFNNIDINNKKIYCNIGDVYV